MQETAVARKLTVEENIEFYDKSLILKSYLDKLSLIFEIILSF
mgnify:CR=1 FL=1